MLSRVEFEFAYWLRRLVRYAVLTSPQIKLIRTRRLRVPYNLYVLLSEPLDLKYNKITT
jgi:hypothetical protein